MVTVKKVEWANTYVRREGGLEGRQNSGGDGEGDGDAMVAEKSHLTAKTHTQAYFSIRLVTRK